MRRRQAAAAEAEEKEAAGRIQQEQREVASAERAASLAKWRVLKARRLSLCQTPVRAVHVTLWVTKALSEGPEGAYGLQGVVKGATQQLDAASATEAYSEAAALQAERDEAAREAETIANCYGFGDADLGETLHAAGGLDGNMATAEPTLRAAANTAELSDDGTSPSEKQRPETHDQPHSSPKSPSTEARAIPRWR